MAKTDEHPGDDAAGSRATQRGQQVHAEGKRADGEQVRPEVAEAEVERRPGGVSQRQQRPGVLQLSGITTHHTGSRVRTNAASVTENASRAPHDA
jgi:hypothetical protein